MATDSERLAITVDFLKSSPPGQINEVFNDLRVLVDNDSLLQEGMPTAFEEHNMEQFVAVAVPGKDYEVILGPHGRIDTDKFYDPRSGQVLVVDHTHLRVLQATPSDSKLPKRLLDQRTAIDNLIQEYAANHYPTFAVTVWASEEDGLVVGIVANKYNPDSFWAGRWRSQWRIPPGATEITGSIKTQVHYYEDGNVQLFSSKEYSALLETSEDPATLAAAAIKQIAKFESEFQGSLNENHNRVSSTTFKTLRRALPITRNKIEWQSILAYKIGSELTTR